MTSPFRSLHDMTDGLSVPNPARVLAETEERLAFALDAGAIALWEWNVITNTTWWSPVLYGLLGLPERDGQESYEAFLSCVHPDDVGRIDNDLAQAIADKRGFDNEFRVKSDDGAERWLVGRGSLVFDDQGNVIGMRGVNFDVTARKETEKELQRLNERLARRVGRREEEQARLWTLSKDAIVHATYEGRILRTNPCAEELFGAHFTSLFDFVPEQNRAAAIRTLNEMGHSPEPSRLNLAMLAADGTLRQMSWSVAPDPSGDSFFAVGRDLTVLLATRAQLSATEARLSQVQRTQTLGELAGGVAHDFNNLLVPILGALDVLKRRTPADAETLQLITSARSAALAARGLVDRILSFAKRQRSDTTTIDAGPLVTGMADLLRHSIPERIALRYEIGDNLPPVTMPQGELELAILNLAVNARDAIADAGTITIGAVRSGGRKSGVEIYVEDDGAGMEQALVRRVIEPFFTTKPAGKGTGLGLFMAKRLAEDAGGELRIKSTPGAGTTVSMILPPSQKPGRATAKSRPHSFIPDHVDGGSSPQNSLPS